MAATVLVVNYYMQLTVVQASLVKGEDANLSLLSQYNPHEIFIALEDVGYLLMSVAFLCASPALARGGQLERIVRWLFVGGFTLTAGALLLLTAYYGHDLEYRFEVLAITVVWSTLIVTGSLLSFSFARSLQG